MPIQLTLLLAALALAPPSGRPPVGPLVREEPRVYDVTFEVSLATWYQFDATQRARYRLSDAPIVMPVIFQGTYSAVSAESLRAQLWLGGREDPGLAKRRRRHPRSPFHTQPAALPADHLPRMPLPLLLGSRLRVRSCLPTAPAPAPRLAACSAECAAPSSVLSPLALPSGSGDSVSRSNSCCAPEASPRYGWRSARTESENCSVKQISPVVPTHRAVAVTPRVRSHANVDARSPLSS